VKDVNGKQRLMMIIAVITLKNSLVPLKSSLKALMEGLCNSNPGGVLSVEFTSFAFPRLFWKDKYVEKKKSS